MTTTSLASREPGRDGATTPVDTQALIALLERRAAERDGARQAVWQMITGQAEQDGAA